MISAIKRFKNTSQEHIGTIDKKLEKDISSLKEKLPEIIRAEIVKGKLE